MKETNYDNEQMRQNRQQWGGAHPLCKGVINPFERIEELETKLEKAREVLLLCKYGISKSIGPGVIKTIEEALAEIGEIR